MRQHRKLFKASLGHCDTISRALDSAYRASQRVPGMRQHRKLFLAADQALQGLGDSVSVFVEVLDEIEWNLDLVETFCKKLEGAGFSVRFYLEDGERKVTLKLRSKPGDEVEPFPEQES